MVRVVLTVSTSCVLGHAQSRHRVNGAPGLQFTMVKRVASRLRGTGKVRGNFLYLESFFDLLQLKCNLYGETTDKQEGNTTDCPDLDGHGCIRLQLTRKGPSTKTSSMYVMYGVGYI